MPKNIYMDYFGRKMGKFQYFWKRSSLYLYLISWAKIFPVIYSQQALNMWIVDYTVAKKSKIFNKL